MLELYDFGLALWMDASSLETESVLISNADKAKPKRKAWIHWDNSNFTVSRWNAHIEVAVAQKG